MAAGHRNTQALSANSGNFGNAHLRHNGGDCATTMVFFRLGLIDFIFRSLSRGSTIMCGTISAWPVVKNGSSPHPVKPLQYLLRVRGHILVSGGGASRHHHHARPRRTGDGTAGDREPSGPTRQGLSRISWDITDCRNDREYHLPRFLEPIACTRSTIRRRTSASSICVND